MLVALLFLAAAGAHAAPEEMLLGDLYEGEVELLVVLFSGSWCSSCVSFTPRLADAYPHVFRAQGAELLWASRERNEKRHARALAKFPAWPAVPYEDERREALNEMFQVREVPGLVVLAGGNTSRVVDLQGYHAVLQLGVEGALRYWKRVALDESERVDHKADYVKSIKVSTNTFAALEFGDDKKDDL